VFSGSAISPRACFVSEALLVSHHKNKVRFEKNSQGWCGFRRRK
jgi:hypothetical protein